MIFSTSQHRQGLTVAALKSYTQRAAALGLGGVAWKNDGKQGTFWMKKSGFSKIPQDRTHPKCFATIWRNSDENGLALKLTE